MQKGNKISGLFNGWFIAGTVFCLLFLVYSALYATKIWDIQTLEIERSLLLRPITRVDCMFYEWRNLGEVPASLVMTCILGGICLLSGFRRRVVLFLLLLLLLGVGAELLGKKLIHVPLPSTLRSGMTVLECPQLDGKPFADRFAAATGQWSKIPDPPRVQVSWAHDVSQMPFVFKAGETENSFPGGHAMRWCFLGLVESWLCWRLIRNRLLRIIFASLCFLGAFLGGFMQFWIGVHFITDTISGYLLGAALACYAISLLTRNDTKRMQGQQTYPPYPTNMDSRHTSFIARS
jgi:membrane-associated phospholipid phosphatase